MNPKTLTAITANHLKGRSFRHDLTGGRFHFFTGPNSSGKTSALQAGALAALGYVPEVGKTNAATLGLSAGDTLDVGIQTGDGVRISRTWKQDPRTGSVRQPVEVAPSRGESGKRQVEERIAEECGQSAGIIPVAELINATDGERARILARLLDGAEKGSPLDDLLSELPDDDEVVEAVRGAWTDSRTFAENLTACLEVLRQMTAAARDEVKRTRATIDRLSESIGSTPADDSARAIVAGERDDLQKERGELLEAIARAEAQVKAAESAATAVANAESRVRRADGVRAQARGAVEAAATAVADAENRLAARCAEADRSVPDDHEEVARARRQYEEADLALGAALDALDDTRVAERKAKAEPEPTPPGEGDDVAHYTARLDKLAEKQRNADRAAATASATADGWRELVRLATEEGTCGKCRREIDDATRTAWEHSLAESEAEAQERTGAARRIGDEIQTVKRMRANAEEAREQYRAALNDREERIREASSARERAERDEKDARATADRLAAEVERAKERAQEALLRAATEAEVEVARAKREHARAVDDVERAEEALDESRLDLTDAEKASAEAPTPADPAPLRVRLTAVETSIKEREEELQSIQRRAGLAEQLATERGALVDREDRASFLAGVHTQAREAASRILLGILEPLAGTANELLARARDGWALRFALRDGGIGLAVSINGVERSGFAGLGGGEQVIFTAALAVAIVQLQAPPAKWLMLEAAELDERNLLALMDAVATMGADLDSVLVAHYLEPASVPSGWTVHHVDRVAAVA